MTNNTAAMLETIRLYRNLLGHPTPEPEGFTRKEWHPFHHRLHVIKRSVPGWLAASRAFAVERFGQEFVAEFEAQHAAAEQAAKEARKLARAEQSAARRKAKAAP